MTELVSTGTLDSATVLEVLATGNKNKIVLLQADPSFDSVILTWLKYHDTSPLPGNQGKIRFKFCLDLIIYYFKV